MAELTSEFQDPCCVEGLTMGWRVMQASGQYAVCHNHR
jgi:hypothetical protein